MNYYVRYDIGDAKRLGCFFKARIAVLMLHI